MSIETEVLFVFTKDDLQQETQHHYGRIMTEDEYLQAKKLLDFGIGENFSQILWIVIHEVMNNPK